MSARLSLSTLDRLPAAVARPGYDIAAQKIGIVHLGIGAFHRAHQAVYVDDRMAAGERDWAILGASLRSPDTRDALQAQDGLYALQVRDTAEVTTRVVGSVRRLLVTPENPSPLLEAMTDPGVRIVSLTVTEKGYCHDPATGTLREDDAGIRHDLTNPTSPRTAPGYIVEALRRRRAAGVAPFTVLCCDNLPSNGVTVRRIVTRLAALRDRGFGDWVEGEVAFPSTMVDRIVPATTDADREAIGGVLGLEDAWPVSTEPFSQFVIEDRFSAGRPRFEDAGAQLVSEVAPFERMKLRMLNGSHSTLAYLGYLAGHETVADTMAAPGFADLVRGMMGREIAPTLDVPQGVDLGHYADELVARFRNAALRHRTWQIAMDGSQKLPQRLLGTISDRLARAAPIGGLALGVAAWMRYVTGIDEAGKPIDVRDPLAERLGAIAAEAGPDATRLAPALLGVREIFGEALPAQPVFRHAVEDSLSRLYAQGAARTVAEASLAESKPA